jgi:hypothetical protein
MSKDGVEVAGNHTGRIIDDALSSLGRAPRVATLFIFMLQVVSPPAGTL